MTQQQIAAEAFDELMDAIEKSGVKMLFWVCPQGCKGLVTWNHQGKPYATCEVCGRISCTAAEAARGPVTDRFAYLNIAGDRWQFPRTNPHMGGKDRLLEMILGLMDKRQIRLVGLDEDERTLPLPKKKE